MKFSPLKIRAKVVRGAGRGKMLGIPTVNLDPKTAKGLKEGIYLCRVNLLKSFWGVLHFGPRPTFNEDSKSLEVYLLDFDEKMPITGELEVEVGKFIRRIIKFESAGAMLKKIDHDIKIARKLALRW